MKARHPAILLSTVAILAASSAPRPLGAADCNRNGTDDIQDLVAGRSRDCDLNGVPDECLTAPDPALFGGLVSLGDFNERKTIADMDGDGDLDIVTAFQDYSTDEGRRGDHDAVVVLFNRGDGQIAREGHTLIGVPIRRHFAADVDGDGDVDVVALLQEYRYASTPRRLRVLLNRGDGAVLAAGSDVPVPGTTSDPVLADIDGDGDLDFISTDYGVYRLSHDPDVIGKDLVVVPNLGGGRFGEARLFPAGDSPDAHARADLDGDGDLDVVVSNTGDVREGQGPTVDTVSVLKSRGDGTFEAPVAHDLGYAATKLAAADLDGDGDADILAMNWSRPQFSVLRGDGLGGFKAITHHDLAEGVGPDYLHVQDLDGDGDVDFVYSHWDHDDRNSVSVYSNRGDGTFDPQAFPYGDAQPIDSTVSDADGDGDLDVAAALYQDGKVALHLNDGSGLFSDAVLVPVEDPTELGQHPKTISVADMDGDGAVDLVAGRAIVFGGAGRLPSGGDNGCREFVRGDVNADGQVSLADVIAIRRWLFSGVSPPSCMDTADASDDESIDITDMFEILGVLEEPDWPDPLPSPSGAPGPDPTYLGGDLDERPIACRAYDVVPPREGAATITFETVVAGPGEEVEIPVLLTSSEPVEGFQLVMEYDPTRLEVIAGASGLSFEGTIYDGGLPVSKYPIPMLHDLSVHPESGVFVAAVIGHFVEEGFEVPAGTEVPVARIRALVPETAEIGTVISIAPAPGSQAGGVGPYRLRNEITVESEARFASVLSSVGIARVNIVGDQAFFRGDANRDQSVNITDAIFLLGALFLGTDQPPCLDAADANDSGNLDLSDAIRILMFLFSGESELPPPHPEAGLDSTPDPLHCRGARN